MFDNAFFLPLTYPFMQQALLIALFISSSCALLSCYLVLRGWSMLGDAMAHAMTLGVVIAILIGIPISIGALGAALLCVVSTDALDQQTHLPADSLLGIVFSGMMALGMLLYSIFQPAEPLSKILFGNILGIQAIDFWQTLLISIAVIIVILLKWKDFLLYVFDENHAHISGLSRQRLRYTLLVLVALTAVAAMQAVGVILIVAMLVAPGITGQMCCRRFSMMLIVAVFSAILASFSGLLASFYWNASPAACIVLSQGIIFMGACIYRAMR